MDKSDLSPVGRKRGQSPMALQVLSSGNVTLTSMAVVRQALPAAADDRIVLAEFDFSSMARAPGPD